ncbi:MAG: glycoside hydrolase family 27 protein [Oscillospiraceae bacterium]|nr:glycoside hydrolase family 27 protein [Oscillospiraceae bacterium]
MLSKTPPMGWNTWNSFTTEINESVVLETAIAMVETGLRDVGYQYVVIDDAWSLSERDSETGRIVADPVKFPRGIQWLSDEIHKRGLKFGMYSCAGALTCGGYPSSFGREYLDAQTFADWGVDFLKYDFCNVPSTANGVLLYQRMGLALKATGREILYSACNGGAQETETWVRSTGAHMYRTTGDINDNYVSITDIAKSQAHKLVYSAPGCYNDMDMLVVGMYQRGADQWISSVDKPKMTAQDYKLHFALWCVMQSPLIIGCDIRSIDDDMLALLKNPALLALNQDEEGRPPYMVDRQSEIAYIYRGLKHLANGEVLLFAFNLSCGIF